ncbi:T9SS type A sorting domain-containing protein [Chryseobacterium daeguense]|nr:T9SS type A sorting domain-containing protein [Chryseobacterium daeguense]
MGESEGTIQEINQKVNAQFKNLQKGVYIITLSNGNEKYTAKLIKD